MHNLDYNYAKTRERILSETKDWIFFKMFMKKIKIYREKTVTKNKKYLVLRETNQVWPQYQEFPNSSLVKDSTILCQLETFLNRISQEFF
jgi:hypothetical protein